MHVQRDGRVPPHSRHEFDSSAAQRHWRLLPQTLCVIYISFLVCQNVNTETHEQAVAVLLRVFCVVCSGSGTAVCYCANEWNDECGLGKRDAKAGERPSLPSDTVPDGTVYRNVICTALYCAVLYGTVREIIKMRKSEFSSFFHFVYFLMWESLASSRTGTQNIGIQVLRLSDRRIQRAFHVLVVTLNSVSLP